MLLKGGRCRHHGGLSTGAKTPEGRAAQIASNMRRKGEKHPNYSRKPKPPEAPTPPAFVPIEELLARYPESIEFWRRIVREELKASGAAEPTTEKEARARRREVTILAVQRRRAWLAGEFELIQTKPTHIEKDKTQ